MANSKETSFSLGMKQAKELFQKYGRLSKVLDNQHKLRMKNLEKGHKDNLKKIDREAGAEIKAVRKVEKERHAARKREEQVQLRIANIQKRTATEYDRQNKKEQREHSKRVRELNRLNGGGGSGGGFFKGIMRAGMFGAGGLLGLVIGSAIRGYQDLATYNQALAPAIGLGGHASRAASRSGRGKGSNLGFNIAERASLIPAMAKSTGVVGPRPMMQAMRATGMDAGEIANIFGAIRQGGTAFSGEADVMQGGRIKTVQSKGSGTREFEKIMAAGMASGLEKARLPEFFEGVTSLMRVQQQMAAGNVGGTGFSKLGAVFGQSGLSGFQGARGMQIMSKLQAGILAPGDMNSMATLQQAFGFGKAGGKSFYEAEKQREKGLTPENFNTVMGEIKGQYGKGQDAALKMREMFNVSLEQAEQLIKISESTDSSSDQMKQVDKILKDSKSIEEQSLAAMKAANTNLTRLAGQFDKSVARGAKAAAAIEAVEDIQDQLVRVMLDYLPVIMRGIESLVRIGQAFADRFKLNMGSDTVPAYDVKDSSKVAVQRALQGMLSGSTKQRTALAPKLSKVGGQVFSQAVTQDSERLTATGWQSIYEAKEFGRKAQFAPRFINAFYKAAGIDKPAAEDQAEAEKALASAMASSKNGEDPGAGIATATKFGNSWKSEKEALKKIQSESTEGKHRKELMKRNNDKASRKNKDAVESAGKSSSIGNGSAYGGFASMGKNINFKHPSENAVRSIATSNYRNRDEEV